MVLVLCCKPPSKRSVGGDPFAITFYDLSLYFPNVQLTQMSQTQNKTDHAMRKAYRTPSVPRAFWHVLYPLYQTCRSRFPPKWWAKVVTLWGPGTAKIFIFIRISVMWNFTLCIWLWTGKGCCPPKLSTCMTCMTTVLVNLLSYLVGPALLTPCSRHVTELVLSTEVSDPLILPCRFQTSEWKDWCKMGHRAWGYLIWFDYCLGFTFWEASRHILCMCLCTYCTAPCST